MLWEKELNSSLYVDFLENEIYSTEYIHLHNKKNNELSQIARLQGNQKYKENDIQGAMFLYNKSICFAETDSEYLGLGFSNRSLCFLKMELYQKCLDDIQLATKVRCPAIVKQKLEIRKGKCTEMINSKVRLVEEESALLSFEADEEMPCIASALKIVKNQKYGRMVTCNRDIEIGETLLVEQTYIRLPNAFDFNECSSCAKQGMNFIPCNKCSTAMYCNEKCAQNIFHEVECDMIIDSDYSCDGLSLPFTLRSIIIGINTFETIHEMMKCVKKWLCTDPHEISKSIASPKSKYRTFFKLASGKPHQRVSQFRKSAYSILNSVMKSELAVKFPTKAEQRFLLHLVVHHCSIIQINSFGGSTIDSATMFEESVPIDYSAYKHNLDLVTSYFNHSCLPNIIRLEKNDLTVLKAILPIKRGEQIYITYLDAFTMDVNERQKLLQNYYGFKCYCQLCVEGIATVNGLQDHHIFLYIVSNMKKVSHTKFDANLISNIKNNCIEFLLKFPKFETSREVAYVTESLGEMLRRELIGR